MFRKLLLTSVALGSLIVGNDAFAGPPPPPRGLSAIDTPITQFYGSINPFYGSISPFYGSINPFYGSISPFYGSINPFYGKISPFWGDNTQFWGSINPFYGSINPFYGKIDPFWGSLSPFYGSISPFYGKIEPFWQSTGPQWGAINVAWDQLQSSKATDYSGVQLQLQNFIGNAQSLWGAAVQNATGKNFMDGFAAPLLAKFGIDPNDPSSLAGVSAQTRSAFFLSWYDGLMNFSGTDHVDWWMGSVHWTPQLTQIQNDGSKSVIGVLDSSFSGSNNDVADLKVVGGYTAYVNNHGAAVASLIAAQHDGQGVMGIAPNSSIVLYNPFDQTGTASWADVQAGIVELYASGASVINASLGVPGSVLSSEWANILTDPDVNKHKVSMVLVKAAGNEGVMQSADVNWTGAQAPTNLLLVGSVGPDGNISSFSNTPGQTCILINNVCNEQNKLMYRFLVAPGENILVSDNNGGITRMTGTSFAAPLVTGAVALLQDRWPWLQQHADETVQIVLQSATDLGAPGVDPIYGWGELNVEASQSPLSFNNLVVYEPMSSGKGLTPPPAPHGPSGTPPSAPSSLPKVPGATAWTTASLQASILNPGQLNLWQQKSAYIIAFEAIGTTYRDFEIPLSTLLVGQNIKNGSINGVAQSYLYQRLIDWANGPIAGNFESQTVGTDRGDWHLSMVATASTPDEMRNGEGPAHGEFIAYDRENGIGLRFGEGNGAHGLAGDNGFSLRSDFDPASGGVNPIVGFASGGVYAQGDIALGTRAKFNIGFTQKADNYTYTDPTFGPIREVPLSTNRASASVIGVDYTLAEGITLNSSYTRLNEASGLLGSQGSGLFSMSGGTQTEAATLGATAKLAEGWEVSGTATAAHSAAPQFAASALSLSSGGLTSTAYEFVATKTGLLENLDQLRFSIAQPLHVESGALEYHSVHVVNRQTGEIGPFNQSWSISGKREYRMETLYSMPVLAGRAEIAAFGLVDLNAVTANGQSTDLSAGAEFRLGL